MNKKEKNFPKENKKTKRKYLNDVCIYTHEEDNKQTKRDLVSIRISNYLCLFACERDALLFRLLFPFKSELNCCLACPHA